MQSELEIEGGPTVRLLSRPAQGTRHEVHFGVLLATGEPVVVKLEGIPGALEREKQALEQLGADPTPAPRLLAAGTTWIQGQRRVCLVTERRAGETPMTDDGWRRMGRAFARLGSSSAPTSPLPVLDHATFGRQHAHRINDLGEHLASLKAAVDDWPFLVVGEVPEISPLVLTHGDPGPGNFLDDGHDGTLLDWEDAHIAPQGLDLARLVFIALLGSGPSGFQARDHQSRARSVIDGYLSETKHTWQPDRAAARWWTTVAGVQFIHRRWESGGQPAPWEDAAHVLETALAHDLSWGRS